MKQNLEQFGQTIKAKYPEYNDIPDAELGQKMLAKYPQYADIVDTKPTRGMLQASGRAADQKAASFLEGIIPGQKIGRSIGTLAGYDLANASDAINKFTGKGPTTQGANYDLSSPSIGETAGDAINAVATPVSFGLGGGTGATLGARALSSGLKFGAAGTVLGAGSALSQGKTKLGDIAGQAALGGVTSGLLGAGGQVVGEGISKIGNSLKERAAKSVENAIRPLYSSNEVKQATGFAGRSGQRVEDYLDKELERPAKAIRDVAFALGKNPEQIVKPGIKQASNNAARLGQTVKDYSENIVSPFLKKSGVNYNFPDLRKSLELVKPSEALEPDSVASYNKVRERVLGAIADRVSPDTKGITSLSKLRNVTNETGKVPEKVLKGDEDFWDARKIIDDIVDEETRGKAWGDASLRGAQAAYKDIRKGFAQYLEDGFRYPGQIENVNKANDFLSTNQAKIMNKSGWSIEDVEKDFGLKRNPMSDANADAWSKHMSDLSGLYDGIANISTQEPKQLGKSWISLFARKHPNIYNTTVFGGAALGLGALGLGAFKANASDGRL